MKRLPTLLTAMAISMPAAAFQLGKLNILSNPGEPLNAEMHVTDIMYDGYSSFVMEGKSNFCPAIDYNPYQDSNGNYVFKLTSVKPANNGDKMRIVSLYKGEVQSRLYEIEFPDPVFYEGNGDVSLVALAGVQGAGEAFGQAIQYTTKSGDTAGTLANQFKHVLTGGFWDRVNRLVEVNPHAFPGGDANVMLANKLLDIY